MPTQGGRVKIVLVDDHALFREGMALILKSAVEDVQLLHAGSLSAAFQLLANDGEVNLVMLDLGLPDVAGVAAVRAMRERWPDVPLVIVSGDDGPSQVQSCIAAGAMAYISKATDSRTMIPALRAVMAGNVVLPDSVDTSREPPATVLDALTPRQREVLQRLVQGKTNKAIALELGIHEQTVKSHVAVVLQTLGVANRTEAVYAVRHWVLDSTPGAASKE